MLTVLFKKNKKGFSMFMRLYDWMIVYMNVVLLSVCLFKHKQYLLTYFFISSIENKAKIKINK